MHFALFWTFVFLFWKVHIQFCSIHKIYFMIFGFVLLHIVCGCLTDIFIFPLFQYCMMDWYLQNVSTHGYVVLEIECSKFVDCICVVSVICFWKVYVVYVRILIFDFVLLHIVCGCLTDIFIVPLLQYCIIVGIYSM